MIPEILYHYCSTATFHAIVSTGDDLSPGHLRLSAVALSNDAKEGLWATDLFKVMLQERGMPAATATWLARSVESWIATGAGSLALCLSEVPDQLSQWRGYADDGCGIMIGLRSASLVDIHEGAAFAPELFQVFYDEDAHRSLLGPLVDKLARGITQHFHDLVEAPIDHSAPAPDESPSLDQWSEWNLVHDVLTEVRQVSFLIKNPAFHEEREWRLLKNGDIKTGTFARRDRLVPYADGKMQPGGIASIVLGPKNTTPLGVLYGMVAGVPNDAITRSTASYR